MTDLIRQALTSVKNFVTGLAAERRRQPSNQVEDEDLFQSQEGHPHQSLPRRPLFNFKLFPFGSESRKRRAEEQVEFELELTDDEDDPGSNYKFSTHLPKRFRPSTEKEVADQEDMTDPNKIYATRSSGIKPIIEGRKLQPWQFDFTFPKPSSKNKILEKNPPSSFVVWDRGELMGSPQPSTSSQSIRNNFANCSKATTSNCNNLKTSQLSSNAKMESNDKRHFENFRFEKNKQDIEVITLDQDTKNLPKEIIIPQKEHKKPDVSKREEVIIKKSLKSPLKSTTRQSMLPNFLSSLCKIRTTDSNTFNLIEKRKYQDLVRKMNRDPLFGTRKFMGASVALQKSKLNEQDITAVFKNWPNASPNVTFNGTGRFHHSFMSPPHSSSTPLPRSLLREKEPKLYSNPSLHTSHPNTPLSSGSPELIDISMEKEEETEKGNALVKFSNGPTSFSPIQSTIFTDLNDALNYSIGEETFDSEQKNESNEEREVNDEDVKVLLHQGLEEEGAPDITILSESILVKGRAKRLNSLALEQSLNPCVKKDWLKEFSSSWKDGMKEREKSIQENLETIDVIQKESTLDRDLRERMRKKLTLTEIIILEPVPTIPDITDDMRMVIDSAKRPGYDNDVLATVFNVDVTRGDIKTLAPCKWLNDNVINVYMELIARRSKEEKSYPTVHAFSTFFYPKLLKEGYSNALKRWTRKVDIFTHDLVVFPIHLGLHWCLACADFRNKSIKYYDSLGGRNDKCLYSLLNYFASEMKERKNEILNKDDWDLLNVQDIPQQQNGSDCGMFTCKFAEYLSRDVDLTFTQENMNYYRERMIYEIIKLDLLFP